MLQAGKMKETADELRKYNLGITALQQVRWPQDGWIKKKNDTLLYSRLKTSKGEYGTGFLYTGCVTQCILGFEPINEGMCKLRMKGKFYNMTIISVYAPTEDENKRNAEDVEVFYNKLSDVCDETPRNDAFILLGDFNAKIGKEHLNKSVAGRHTLHGTTSENGGKLVQLAIAHNLEISSTKFQHRRIHKGTWNVPGQDICNQMDHVLINKRRVSTIINVHTYIHTYVYTFHRSMTSPHGALGYETLSILI
jgi:exonuclease III